MRDLWLRNIMKDLLYLRFIISELKGCIADNLFIFRFK